jgi:hypothetical protein
MQVVCSTAVHACQCSSDQAQSAPQQPHRHKLGVKLAGRTALLRAPASRGRGGRSCPAPWSGTWCPIPIRLLPRMRQSLVLAEWHERRFMREVGKQLNVAAQQTASRGCTHLQIKRLHLFWPQVVLHYSGLMEHGNSPRSGWLGRFWAQCHVQAR